MTESEFETLLHQKIFCNPKYSKETKYVLVSRCKKEYRETGKIPQRLLADNPKSLCGRKSEKSDAIDKEVTEFFIELAKKSCDPGDDNPFFISQTRRTITNLHKRMELHFNRVIPVTPLYYLAKKHNLKEWLDKPDSEGAKFKVQGNKHFEEIDVMALLQCDGVYVHGFEIVKSRDDEGKPEYDSPVFIHFLDSGSRFKLAMGIYFSETMENAIDVFCNLCEMYPLPKKEIFFRGDHASAYKNFDRVFAHINGIINRKYSEKGGFELVNDLARVRRFEDKRHIERSHVQVHQDLEDDIILTLQTKGYKYHKALRKKYINGKIDERFVFYFDITIEELRSLGIVEKWLEKENSRQHLPTVDGERKKIVPSQKFEEYMKSADTVKIDSYLLAEIRRYSFPKERMKIKKEKQFWHNSRQFYFKDAKIFSQIKALRLGKFDYVRVSVVGNEMMIFQDTDDGLYLGSAFSTEKGNMDKARAFRSHQKKHDTALRAVCNYLEKRLIAPNEELLSGLVSDGLTKDITHFIISNDVTFSDKKYRGWFGLHYFMERASDYLEGRFEVSEVSDGSEVRLRKAG